MIHFENRILSSLSNELVNGTTHLYKKVERREIKRDITQLPKFKTLQLKSSKIKAAICLQKEGSSMDVHLKLYPLNWDGEVWKNFEQSVIKMSLMLLCAVWAISEPPCVVEELTSVVKNCDGSLIRLAACLVGRRDFLVDCEAWKTFQNLNVSSAAALATVVPSGLSAKCNTRLVWPRRSAIFFI